MKPDPEYLIIVEVIIETGCLQVLGIMQCCTIPDVVMLRRIAYKKSRYMAHSGKENAIIDMLSRAQFGDEVAE